MRLKLFKSLWGTVVEDAGKKTVQQVLSNLTHEGYTGVECSVKLAHVLNKDGTFQRLMHEYGLEWIPIVFSSGPVNGWDPFVYDRNRAAHRDDSGKHRDALLQQIDDAFMLASGVNIKQMTAHTGHDSFSEAEMQHLAQLLPAVEAAAGVPVVNEIHRGRMFNNPWSIARLLQHHSHHQTQTSSSPAADIIKLVADISHFTCACEVEPWDGSLLQALEPLYSHVHHLHARVGYENGPQVPDPRCHVWSKHVQAFDQIWIRCLVNMLRVKGEASVTMEYGPPSYQHVLPFSDGEPAADIDEVNAWTAGRIRQLFDEAIKHVK